MEEEAEKAQAEEAERQRRREESERDLQRQLGKFSMHIITPHKRLPIFCKVTMFLSSFFNPFFWFLLPSARLYINVSTYFERLFLIKFDID